LAAALGLLTLALRPPDWQTAAALVPRPDALEYSVAALHLATGHGLALRIGDQWYPPRYPPGFPLVLAGWYRLVGPAPEQAAALGPLLSVVGVVLLYLACRRSFGRFASVAAALLVCLSKLQIESSRPVLSESLAFALGCALLLAAPRAESSKWRWFSAGLTAGALGPTRIIFWPGALLAALLPACARRPGAALAYLAGAGGLLAAWLADRYLRLGSIWASGYAYWLPPELRSLEPGNLLRTPDGPGTLRFYSTQFLRWDSAWPAAATALAALGVWAVWKLNRRAAWTAALGAAVLVLPNLILLFFFFLDRRFLVPALPMLAFSSAPGLEFLLAGRRRRWIGAALASGALLQAAALCLRLPPPSQAPLSGELSGLRAAASRLRDGDLLVTDAALVLAGWQVPQAQVVLLQPWLDEHYSRLSSKSATDEPRSERRFPVPVLWVDPNRIHPPTLELMRRAWRERRRTFLLLTGARDRFERFVRRLRPLELELVARDPLWLLALVKQSPAPRPDRASRRLIAAPKTWRPAAESRRE
jgi:hypothetical protein